MRWLLQLGTLLLFLAIFVTPISECFDRWDAPGLGNDVEFGLFTLVFMLVLVLALCSMLAALALRISLSSSPAAPPAQRNALRAIAEAVGIFASPPLLTPLRI